MADKNKKQVSIFQNVLAAINGRRKTFDYEYGTPVNKITHTPPQLDRKSGIENMQQQYLDWQVKFLIALALAMLGIILAQAI